MAPIREKEAQDEEPRGSTASGQDGAATAFRQEDGNQIDEQSDGDDDDKSDEGFRSNAPSAGKVCVPIRPPPGMKKYPNIQRRT